MADTVSDVTEKVLGTPEKEVVEKKVVEEVEDVDDEDSKPSENGDTNGDDASDDVKENGSAVEENGGGDSAKKNGNGVDKESDIIATKRKSAGGDNGKVSEEASPEKKAKLSEDPVEVEANGDAEIVA